MKLQVALDGTLQDSIRILDEISPFVDIAEIGTPLIYREGVSAVRLVRTQFPALSIVADLKIMDAGAEEAEIAFDAGANVVTVLAGAHDETIRGVVAAAERAKGLVLADFIGVRDVLERGRTLRDLGVDILCIHTGTDTQSRNAVESALEVCGRLKLALPDSHLAVAGGIGLDLVDRLLVLRPAVIIVGGAITRADFPAKVAAEIGRRVRTI